MIEKLVEILNCINPKATVNNKFIEPKSAMTF